MRRKLIAGLATLALAGLSVAGCGDGETTEEDATVDNDTMEEMDTGVEPDTTPDTYQEPDSGGSPDGESNPDGSSDDCAGCVADEFKDDTIRNCSENADERPARCDKNPAEFSDWGPGSVVTSLELTSDEAKECCFNIDNSDDGSNDNGLGKTLDTLSGFIGTNIDQEIKASLVGGEIVILNEHAGLTDLTQSGEFAVNFYLGMFGSVSASDYVQKVDSSCDFGDSDSNCELEGTSGESFLINPESFDEGTHPQAQVSPAAISDSQISGGPGNVVLNLALPSLGKISLNVRGATIEATADEQASDIGGDGVVLTEGKLGGYVLMKDVLTLLNNVFTSSCDCLGDTQKVITGYNTDPSETDLFPDVCARENPPEGECSLSCTQGAKDNYESCGNSSSEICSNLSTICSVTGVLKQARDLDADGDGQEDAISMGAMFKTVGARLEGIADYVAASDQQVSGGEVTVDRVFANESGWLAVYSDNSLGSEHLLGSTELQAGLSQDVTVSVSGVSSEQDVWAVLHTDDGSGSFEADTDPLVKHYPEMSGSVSTMFHVTP